jgi:uncharacterized membrane protein YbhN (UPF0104 family)
MRARWLQLTAWVVATTLIVVLVRSTDTKGLIAALGSANGAWLAAAILSFLAIQPLGGMQWRSFLPAAIAPTRRRMVEVFSLTSVANNSTTSVVGHAAGVALLAAEAGVGLGPAVTVLAYDQLTVGTVKLLVFALATVFAPLPSSMAMAFGGLVVALGVLLAAMVVLALNHERLTTWRPANQWLADATALVARTGASLRAVRGAGPFLKGAGFQVAIRVAEGSAIAAVQYAFGLEVSLSSTLLVLAATNIATVVPFVPANLGTYEAAVFGAYRILGISEETALALAVAQHACQLLPAVGAGYLLLTLRPAVVAPSKSAPGA